MTKIILLVYHCVALCLHADAATSPTRLSSDRDASKMQLMASMSSVGGGDSLQDVWAMMESGLVSPRTATPRHPNTDSMRVLPPFAYELCGVVFATFLLNQSSTFYPVYWSFHIILRRCSYSDPLVSPLLLVLLTASGHCIFDLKVFTGKCGIFVLVIFPPTWLLWLFCHAKFMFRWPVCSKTRFSYFWLCNDTFMCSPS